MHVKNNKYIKARENIPPRTFRRKIKQIRSQKQIKKAGNQRDFFFVRKAMPIWPSTQFRLNENKNDFLLLTVKHVKHIRPSSGVVYKITFFKQEGVDRSDNCKNSYLSAIFFIFIFFRNPVKEKCDSPEKAFCTQSTLTSLSSLML